MNPWAPSTLRALSSNNTLIVFDSHGVGNTTTGIKPFTIQQLANDTAGLLGALKIQKVTIKLITRDTDRNIFIIIL
jgi:pimeloyl-ACP methyl ester carboxylesterase